MDGLRNLHYLHALLLRESRGYASPGRSSTPSFPFFRDSTPPPGFLVPSSALCYSCPPYVRLFHPFPLPLSSAPLTPTRSLSLSLSPRTLSLDPRMFLFLFTYCTICLFLSQGARHPRIASIVRAKPEYHISFSSFPSFFLSFNVHSHYIILPLSWELWTFSNFLYRFYCFWSHSSPFVYIAFPPSCTRIPRVSSISYFPSAAFHLRVPIPLRFLSVLLSPLPFLLLCSHCACTSTVSLSLGSRSFSL